MRLNVICVLLVLASNLKAQVNSGIPFIHNYSPADYNQGTQNFAIIKDHTGILYIGNSNGVLEFDGNQFYLIPISNQSQVHSFGIDSAGTIYVGAQGDFGFLKRDSLNGSMKYVSLISKIEERYRYFNDVWSVHITPHEVIFRSTLGLYIYRNQKIKVIPFKSSNHRSFYINGEVFVREENFGLRKLVNDSLVTIPGGDFFLHEGLLGMFPVQDNKYLMITFRSGLFEYDGSNVEKLKAPAEEVITGQINFCEMLSPDRFGICTRRNGLVIIDSHGNVISQIDKSKGLQDNTIWHFLQDPQTGDLWLAENNGFSLIEFSSPFSLFGKDTGLDGQFNHSIKHGEYLYTAGATGVYYKKWSQSSAESDYNFLPIKDLGAQSWHFYQDSTTLLVATNSGIFEITGDHAKNIGFTARSWYFLPLKNFPGHVLVNAADGLLILQKKNNHFEIKSKIQNQVASFYLFAEDAAGNIWTDSPTKGIFRIQFKNGIDKSPDIVLYNSKHGFPSDLKLRAFASSQGVLFGSEKGIYRYDDKKDLFYPDKNLNAQLSLENDYVEYIDEAPSGDIGFTAKRTHEGYDEWIKGIAFKESGSSYTLRIDEFQKIKNFKVFDFLVVDPENIFLSTSDGIVHFNSDRENKAAFKVLVRKIELLKTDSTLFHGTAPAELRTKLPYASNDLRFTIASTDLRSPGSMQYQYFLEGSDQEWSPWTNVNVKEYTNLKEGSYTLHVRARNQYYQISEITDLAFTIAAPWYRTVVAYFGYMLLLSLLIYLAIVLNAKKLNAQNLKLEKMVAERTQEIKLQHENIVEKNRLLEIQKEEINAQNENIRKQNEALERARETIAIQVEQLKSVNQGLEENVAERTKQLQNAYHDLLATKNELDTFIYRSSHDINGPLMRLRGLCRTAAIDVTDLTSLKYFRMLDREVDVMARMLQKLIFFYNIKNSEPKAERVELQVMINRAIQRQQNVPGFSKIKFQINTSAVNLVVTDGELLEAAVSNMVENAVMYSAIEESGIVKISTERTNGSLQIIVNDNGQGIDQAISDKIFDMFFRGTERSHGAGLGLYIAREAIKRLNGEIQFTTSQGTTFTISVPVG